MNKHTKKQLHALESEQRYVQKTKAKKKAAVKKKTTTKKVQRPSAASNNAFKADSDMSAAAVVQSTEEIKQDIPAKVEPDEAAIEAAALEWALTVVKNNLTSKWIEEEV